MGWWPQRLRLTGRKKWFALGALLFLPVSGVTTVEVTSQSWFCNSCHIMEPYYSSWSHGRHKNIECVKCHISPGVDNFLAAKFNGLGQVVDDVLHRTSPKPSASVSQLACTRSGCHSIEKVRETVKTSGKFKFRHDKHLGLEYEGIPLACGTCHSHIKGNEHFEVNTGTCITCHLIEKEHNGTTANGGTAGHGEPVIRLAVRESRSGLRAPDSASPEPAPATAKVPPASCTTCHDAPKGVLERNGLKVDHAQFLSYGAACESCHRNATATPEPIGDSRCLECHNFGVERTMSEEEMHKVHSQGRHKIECLSCHGTIVHGTTAQSASLQQFDCRRCHQDQHAIQRRAYLTDGIAAHTPDGAQAVSPMFLAHVDCTGCHIKKRPVSVKPDSGATVAAATAEACDVCHKPGLGAQMIPLWQRTTHALYDQVAAEMKTADAAGVDKESIEQARKLLEVVRMDSSWGVHNPRYTQQLLEQARDKLAAARGVSPAPAKEGPH